MEQAQQNTAQELTAQAIPQQAVEVLAALQAASAPAVTPDMAAAAAIFRKPLREILFMLG